jgi:hypothetical protein
MFLARKSSMSLNLRPAMPAFVTVAIKRKLVSGLETFLVASAAVLAVACFSLASVYFALV